MLIPWECVPALFYKYKSPSCSAFSFSQWLCSCSFSVPTVDTTRTAWLLEQMVKAKRPVVLVGESGTSKTATTQNFLNNLDKDYNVCLRHFALFINLHFHSLPLCYICFVKPESVGCNIDLGNVTANSRPKVCDCFENPSRSKMFCPLLPCTDSIIESKNILSKC